MTRRAVIGLAVAGVAAAVGGVATEAAEPTVAALPPWRGFNLSELFDASAGARPFQEFDFDAAADWGFDFVRLPCSYRCWADGDPDRWLAIDETVISRTLDDAVRWGRARGIHVNLGLHRIPGYCVSAPAEALDLWSDERALDAAAYHWTHLAERYRGVPRGALSFNLVNEPPPWISVEQYLRVHRRLRDAIHAVDANRLVIADALRFATTPTPQLAGEGMAVGVHAYDPFELSHFRAPWIEGAESWPEPTWPLVESGSDGDRRWDAERLQREEIDPFRQLERQSVGVHVGEWGAYQFTPHDVTLRWMADRLRLWRQAGWGWALWNLRGGFGVLDSGRTDVKYESYRGHLLDRQMLELLREPG